MVSLEEIDGAYEECLKCWQITQSHSAATRTLKNQSQPGILAFARRHRERGIDHFCDTVTLLRAYMLQRGHMTLNDQTGSLKWNPIWSRVGKRAPFEFANELASKPRSVSAVRAVRALITLQTRFQDPSYAMSTFSRLAFEQLLTLPQEPSQAQCEASGVDCRPGPSVFELASEWSQAVSEGQIPNHLDPMTVGSESPQEPPLDNSPLGIIDQTYAEALLHLAESHSLRAQLDNPQLSLSAVEVVMGMSRSEKALSMDQFCLAVTLFAKYTEKLEYTARNDAHQLAWAQKAGRRGAWDLCSFKAVIETVKRYKYVEQLLTVLYDLETRLTDPSQDEVPDQLIGLKVIDMLNMTDVVPDGGIRRAAFDEDPETAELLEIWAMQGAEEESGLLGFGGYAVDKVPGLSDVAREWAKHV